MRTRQAERGAWSTRPAFRPRQMLTAEQLNTGFADEMKRQMLLNRAVHGFGAVLGLGLGRDEGGGLDIEHGCIEVTAGLALDRHGRMLVWRGGRIGFGDLAGDEPCAAGHYTLVAHWAVLPPEDDECLPHAGDRSLWTEEGVVFSLRRGCTEVDRRCATHPSGACVDHETYLCRRTGAMSGDDPGSVPVSDDVEWLLDRTWGRLCPTGCDGWWYDPDPDVGVPIACVEIGDTAADGCDPCWAFGSEAGTCTVRPYVYRNPLLYDLVKGCDVQLSRVRAVSWQDWVDAGWWENVPWNDFAEKITEGLAIIFTRPIRVDTIHPASVFVTVLTQERNTDYWESYRVPVRIYALDRYGEATSDDLASGVALVPESDWLTAEVTGSRSTLYAGARFEVTVRGHLLRDECGRMLDARPVDIEPGERGQDRPGGDFVSAFRVGRRVRDGYGATAAGDHQRADSGDEGES